jgi:circadian clock protein KaiB
VRAPTAAQALEDDCHEVSQPIEIQIVAEKYAGKATRFAQRRARRRWETVPVAPVCGRSDSAIAPGVEQSQADLQEHLAGRSKVEVIDLGKTPQLAAGDQILAIPTLIRPLPKPVRRIIGDLSNTERVLVGLDVQAPK